MWLRDSFVHAYREGESQPGGCGLWTFWSWLSIIQYYPIIQFSQTDEYSEWWVFIKLFQFIVFNLELNMRFT